MCSKTVDLSVCVGVRVCVSVYVWVVEIRNERREVLVVLKKR